MCRIAGIWQTNTRGAPDEICLTMRDALERGGPDDAGMYLDKTAGLALGHRRLSIIDLSPAGHQPMSTSDGRYTITYNGEVYNYQELRKTIESYGFQFRSTSDTEVVLNAFALWGPECVDNFIGMFAFAVWDAQEKSLFLFRDRIGVKPLFYYNNTGTFAFSSELKGLHAGLGNELSIDETALGEFFHYGYISAPRSIYKNTYKIEPGCWIKVSSDLMIEKHRYWSYPKETERSNLSDNEDVLTDQLEEIMIDAFTKRLIADVPVGVFLSGGIDSSLVTAILSRHANTSIKTFTIGFREKNYDESRWAQEIARHLGTEHTQEIVTPEHAKDILPLWPEIYDEPFGDISGIPTTILSAMTRKHVKVSLSADGGDELFCGYHRYWVMSNLERFLTPLPKILPRMAGKAISLLGNDLFSTVAQAHPRLRLPAIKDRMRKFQSVLKNWEGSCASAYPFAVGYWLPHEIRLLVGSYMNQRQALETLENNILGAMMQWDLQYYLPDDILTKVDRATMYASLEGRDPFLDHRIVEFARCLPLEMKYRGRSMKYILKKLLSRYLPERMFDRPKQGFAVPMYTWLHNDLINLIGHHLNPDRVKDQPYLDPDLVNRTVTAFIKNKDSFLVDRIWLLLVFMMWREKYNF